MDKVIFYILFLFVIPQEKRVPHGGIESGEIISPFCLIILFIYIYSIIKKGIISSNKGKEKCEKYLLINKIELFVSIFISIIQCFNLRILSIYTLILSLSYLIILIVNKVKKRKFCKEVLISYIIVMMIFFINLYITNSYSYTPIGY